MVFVPSEEQRQAADVAVRFFGDRAPTSLLRRLRDENAPLHFDPAVWAEMGSLGLQAVALGEGDGGIGLGFVAMGRILLEGGKTLAPSPLFATSVLGASVIECAGTSEQRERYLPLVAEGALTLCFAHEESAHHDPELVATRATQNDTFRLSGSKRYVLDGDIADKIIVVARTSGEERDQDGLSFFMLDREMPGVSITSLSTVDSRSIAHIDFTDVVLDEASLIGTQDAALPAFERVLDRARACMAAEMLGIALELFDRTIAYLGQREQFGVKIGSFQALKHRAAQMFTELELSKSVVFAALHAIDEAAADAASLCTLAKARLNDTLNRVSNEAIQMHGGMGVTDELDLGLFLKRARVAAQCFGASPWLRQRYAMLNGY